MQADSIINCHITRTQLYIYKCHASNQFSAMDFLIPIGWTGR